MSADAARLDGLRGEIARYQHAVQTGVAIINGRQDDRGECSPKHLRVGVNSALIDGSAVAKVLIDKGIISEVEYFAAVRDLWRREYEDYRDRVRRATGNPIIDIG